MDSKRRTRFATLSAVIVGVAAGSYGVASAASGSSSTATSAATSTTPSRRARSGRGVGNEATRRC